MNNQRRKTIAKSLEKLKKASALLAEVKAAEETSMKSIPMDDEFDEKRDAIEAIADGLENVISSIEESIDTLDNTDF